MTLFRRSSKLISNVVKRYFASNRELDSVYVGTEADVFGEAKKLLKIAILGLPNSGKSTLINQIVKRPVCASSCRIHTTRINAFAVYNEKNTQLIFIDTPGLTSKKDRKKFELGEEFDVGIKKSIKEAHVIGIMQDMQVPKARQSISKRILDIVTLADEETSFILILNKVDLVKDKSILLEVVNNLTDGYKITFQDIFMTSALKKTGVDDIRNYFLEMAKPKEWEYEEDVYTNQKPEEIVERVVRAKCLDNIKQEVPYNMKIEIVHLDYDDAGNLVAIVSLKPERARQFGILLGEKGMRIRIIALQAEQELCNIFRTGVRLKLNPVKEEKPPTEKKSN